MIASAEVVRRLMNDPEFIAGQLVDDDDRLELHRLGVRPLIDQLIEAFAAGEGIDTSEQDVLGAVQLHMLKVERDMTLRELHSLGEGGDAQDRN